MRAKPIKSNKDNAQTNFDLETSARSSGVRPEVSMNAEALPEGKSICSWAGWIDCDMVTRGLRVCKCSEQHAAFTRWVIYGIALNKIVGPRDRQHSKKSTGYSQPWGPEGLAKLASTNTKMDIASAEKMGIRYSVVRSLSPIKVRLHARHLAIAGQAGTQRRQIRAKLPIRVEALEAKACADMAEGIVAKMVEGGMAISPLSLRLCTTAR